MSQPASLQQASLNPCLLLSLNPGRLNHRRIWPSRPKLGPTQDVSPSSLGMRSELFGTSVKQLQPALGLVLGIRSSEHERQQYGGNAHGRERRRFHVSRIVAGRKNDRGGAITQKSKNWQPKSKVVQIDSKKQQYSAAISSLRGERSLGPDRKKLQENEALGQVMAAQANFLRVLVTERGGGGRDGRVRTEDGEELSGRGEIDKWSWTGAKFGSRGLQSEGEVELLCVVRALLKKVKRRVLVGDQVVVGGVDWVERRGMVEDVLPRSTFIIDPPIANVDHLVVMFSLARPPLEPMNLSRFLVAAEATGVPFSLVLNKKDLVSEEEQHQWVQRLSTWGYSPILSSVTNINSVAPEVAGGAHDSSSISATSATSAASTHHSKMPAQSFVSCDPAAADGTIAENSGVFSPGELDPELLKSEFLDSELGTSESLQRPAGGSQQEQEEEEAADCPQQAAAAADGVKQVLSLLSGRVSVIAGPSGVGKSSLINEMRARARGMRDWQQREGGFVQEGREGEGHAASEEVVVNVEEEEEEEEECEEEFVLERYRDGYGSSSSSDNTNSSSNSSSSNGNCRDGIQETANGELRRTSLLSTSNEDNFAELSVGDVSARSGRGRHTTRHVSLLQLPGGGLLADSPGFNQPTLATLTTADLPLCFPEIRSRMEEAGSRGDRCLFADCEHVTEPGCVVGSSWERWRHYCLLLEEVKKREGAEMVAAGTKRESNVRLKDRGAGSLMEEPRLNPKKHRRQSRKRSKQKMLVELAELE